MEPLSILYGTTKLLRVQGPRTVGNKSEMFGYQLSVNDKEGFIVVRCERSCDSLQNVI
ncbi:hypothetical protein RvY_03697 [Ramazzottius varieornatus]|uniref:Uncharacterized protein n=1 Tax=Ramazzottius varieornatus TaxID=947166 RepID=A0A1D1UW53_RAMVA|nr:hypothetical protein RvY_03697 [Ramazzottius varieornatus]